MSNETQIDKILNYMKQYVENIYEHDSEPMLNWKDLEILLDYITNLQENYEKIYNENCKLRKQHNINDISLLDENHNLQEENERLKIEKQEEYNRFNLMSKFRDRALERELIYKSRNEKAIELINAWLEGLNNDDIIILLNDLGNILKGSE